MKIKTFRVSNSDQSICEYFDTYTEALNRTLKLGDQNRLARIDVLIQAENPIEL